MPSLPLTHRADAAVPVSADTPVPFARISFALFLAGFSTFSLLYCVQPLLPEFAGAFGLSPAQSSLALSLATGALAVAIFSMGALSQALPRRGLMATSMVLAALLNLAAALAPSWPLLLTCRLLEGLVLGGVPAVAMAYLAEEMEPRRLGSAMGLYVGGTAFGGMMGLGVLVTLGSSLAAIATGVGLVTIGFFIAHAVASAWVGQLAGAHKGHAASLYLLFYYLGSSSIGAVGGWFWLHGGWPAEVALTTVLAALGLGLAWAQGRPNQDARHG
ncbi:MFS transporter [Ideonella sp. B508-1]|uniref:MFS transporter n=1 Tax=Ideonella sp. B508-1 TaxID=137716 RepID=UPI000A03F62F|nr:MFS transporter [Ideonella sp. B508-1]